MPDRKIFSWHFEPVVQIGERVLLLTNVGYIYGEVEWIEPIPWLEVVTDTIPAGGKLTDREMEEIYVEDNEFAQWRMMITTDNIYMIEHSCPKAAKYYSTKSSLGVIPPVGQITNDAIKRLQLCEFYQYKDTKRYMTFENRGTADTTATLVFVGYVFQFSEINRYKELKDVPRPYTAIPCVSKYGKTRVRSEEE